MSPTRAVIFVPQLPLTGNLEGHNASKQASQYRGKHRTAAIKLVRVEATLTFFFWYCIIHHQVDRLQTPPLAGQQKEGQPNLPISPAMW